ncbi:MAG: hypothetical protein HYV63_06410 [Candidatus Schekmanbacteria bacterium]|nr:hypothetical protein [Candidatus Schekmanbacteria bacterium]
MRKAALLSHRRGGIPDRSIAICCRAGPRTRVLAAVTLLLAAASVGGCSRRAPAATRPSLSGASSATAMAMRSHFVCSSLVSSADGPPAFGVSGTKFYTTEQQLVAVVELDNVLGDHEVRFVWYQPGGTLYLESESRRVPRTGAYHRYAAMWHSVNVTGERASALPGEWKVVVFLDTAILTTMDFSLVAGVEPAPEARP